MRALVEQSHHRWLIGVRLFGIEEGHGDLLVRQDPEQMDGQPFAAREPLVEIGRGEDYRLAIMDRLHDGVGFTGECGECLFPSICIRIFPVGPDPGYSEELTAKDRDFIFAFRSVFGVLPLEE